MTCNCSTMAGYGPDSWGKHHHVNCPLYKTEKHPYLFYWEDAVDAWIPAPDYVEGILTVDQLDEGEKLDIQFWRIDKTDAEIAAMPEI